MKIEKIELFKVQPRWLFLKVTTDSGLAGWGEPIVEGRADTVEAAVKELSEYIIGRDPRQVEDIWQVFYRAGFYRGGPVLTSAVSGLDQALWDIKSKDVNLPIYDMLGGAVRERMRMYAWIQGDSPSELADAAEKRFREGYSAIKMNGVTKLNWVDSFREVDRVVQMVAAIRERLENKIDIALDFHGRVHRAMAKQLIKELERYKPMFIEEPVLTENEELFIELARLSSIPIATGERNYTRWGFKRLFEQRGVDIAQPDLSHAGGISECRKIGTMAEAYDIAIAFHCPLGPIALAACLQLDFTLINAAIQEQSLDVHSPYTSELFDYLVDPSVLACQNGFIERMAAPGLGIEINEDNVRAAAQRWTGWKNPVWRSVDGAVIEW